MKTWSAVTLVCWVRLRTEAVGVFLWMSRGWRALLLTSAALIGGVVAWVIVAPRLTWRMQSAVSAATFATCAAFALLTAIRWRMRRAPATRSYVPSPFRARSLCSAML